MCMLGMLKLDQRLGTALKAQDLPRPRVCPRGFFFYVAEVGHYEVRRGHLMTVRVIRYDAPTDRCLWFQSARQSGL